MVSDFDMKTGLYSTGAALCGAAAVGTLFAGSVLAVAPLAAGGAIGYGVLQFRQRCCSLKVSHNEALEKELKEKHRKSYRITEMIRRVDGGLDLAQILEYPRSSPETSNTQMVLWSPTPPQQQLSLPWTFPGQAVMFLKLDPGRGSDSEQPLWIKVWFSIYGLTYRQLDSEETPRRDQTPGYDSTLLKDVPPFELAKCFMKISDKTFNATTWNSHHVATRIWDEMRKSEKKGENPPSLKFCDSCCKRLPLSVVFLECCRYAYCHNCSEKFALGCPVCAKSIKLSPTGPRELSTSDRADGAEATESCE